MTYQEEKQVKMRRQNSKHAISLAIQGKWEEAIEVNKHLIENFPQDADAYNRLGKAYLELGRLEEAEEAYKHAIEFDPYNVIAKKNLNRMSFLNKTETAVGVDEQKAKPDYFIEETGKSRVFALHRPASSDALAKTIAGNNVELRVDGASLIVQDKGGAYLGMIEPRFAQRLVQLINGGNKYTAAVVSSAGDSISVIIREIYRSPAQVGLLSFPGRKYEEVSSSMTDKVFRDSTEFADVWGMAAEVTPEAETEESTEEVPGDKEEHDEA